MPKILPLSLAMYLIGLSSVAISEQNGGFFCDLIFYERSDPRLLCEAGTVSVDSAVVSGVQGKTSGEVVSADIKGTHRYYLVEEVKESLAHKNLWEGFDTGINLCRKDSLCVNDWGYSYLELAFESCLKEARSASLSDLFEVGRFFDSGDRFLPGFFAGNAIGCEASGNIVFVVDFSNLPSFGLSGDDKTYRESLDRIRVVLFKDIEK